MRKRLFRLRRVGVAALAGATLIGAIGIIGEVSGGIAGAAIDGSTVSATSNNLIGNTAQTAGTWTISLPSTDTTFTAGDQFQLTVTPTGGCTSTSSLAVGVGAEATTITGGTAQPTVTVTAPSTSNGCTGGPNVINIAIGAGTNNTGSAMTIAIAGITYTPLITAAGGAVAVTADYLDSTGTTGAVTFPSNAVIGKFAVAGATPVPNIAAGSTNQNIGNVSVTEPFANTFNTAGTGEWACLTLNSGTWYPSSTLPSNGPSVSATGGTGAATVTNVAGTSPVIISTTVMAFGIASSSTTVPTTFTLSSVLVNAPATNSGSANVTLTTATTSAGCTAGATVDANKPNIFSTIGGSQPFQGTTADATAADEFEATFGTGCTESGGSVVLATDVDPYDALSASYLAGELGTGVIITPQVNAGGSLGSDAQLAMRLEGVTNVYVVGGPLAVGPGLTASITSTPAYKCGGITLTGSNLTVSANLYGTTDDDTALAVNEYFPKTVAGTLALSGAYSATGGLYDDTFATYGGSGTSTGTTGTGVTAFLVGDADYQDAITIGPIAYAKHIPIILTPAPYVNSTSGTLASAIGTDAAAEFTYFGVTQLIVAGGPLAIEASVVSSAEAAVASVLRVSGLDGTDTAVQFANLETGSSTTFKGLGWVPASQTILLATGAYWSDPLGIEAMAGTNFWPILLTESPSAATAAAGLGTYTTAELNQAGNTASSPQGLGGTLITKVEVLGGTLAVPTAQTTQAEADLAAG